MAGLSPNSVYRFRVTAFNAAGIASDTSGYTQAATPEVKEYEAPLPSNCELHMTVDCSNGDVVVGDMIMFTEPVYIKVDDPNVDYTRRDELPKETTEAQGQYLADRTICAVVVAEKRQTAGSTARAMRGTHGRGALTARSGAMSVVSMTLDGASVTSSVRRDRDRRKMLGLSVVWCKSIGRTLWGGGACRALDAAALSRRRPHEYISCTVVARSPVPTATRGTHMAQEVEAPRLWRCARSVGARRAAVVGRGRVEGKAGRRALSPKPNFTTITSPPV